MLWTILAAAAALFPVGSRAENIYSATLNVGIPHPLNGALDGNFADRALGAGIAGGGLGLTVNQVHASIANGEARFRWFPFHGAFFLGMGAGYQSFSASEAPSIPVTVGSSTVNVPTSVKVSINSPYLTPHLGWFWILGSRFTLGFELGLQVPFAAATQLDISISDPTMSALLSLVQQTPAYQTAQSDVQTLGDRLGNLNLPYGNIRIGWSF